MSESYQPIYDAVRSRISGGNISDAVSAAMQNAGIGDSAGRAFQAMADDFCVYWTKPSVLYRPTLQKDGDSWGDGYGDFPTGVWGFGATPAEAMADFDKHWNWTDEQIKQAKEKKL